MGTWLSVEAKDLTKGEGEPQRARWATEREIMNNLLLLLSAISPLIIC